MQLGTLRAIHRYPVKSLRGETLDSALITQSGIEGDRARALLVTEGHARVGKTYRGKENNQLHLAIDPADAQALGRIKNVATTIEESEDGYFDDAPISILVDRWLDGLSAHLGSPVDYRAFRPNFYVEAAPAFNMQEDDLSGRELSLGEVMLRVRYPIERCVTITYDQNDGTPDPRILRYVTQERSTWMGIYCDVLRAGTVRTLDSFALVVR
jgi:uncharacterized protein YcbX